MYYTQLPGSNDFKPLDSRSLKDFGLQSLATLSTPEAQANVTPVKQEPQEPATQTQDTHEQETSQPVTPASSVDALSGMD